MCRLPWSTWSTHPRLVPKESFPANCLLTTGRLREACFISYLLTLQGSRGNTKGARRQSRVHSILKIPLASWMMSLLFKKEWSCGSKFHTFFYVLLENRDVDIPKRLFMWWGWSCCSSPISFLEHKVQALIKQDKTLRIKLKDKTFSFLTENNYSDTVKYLCSVSF